MSLTEKAIAIALLCAAAIGCYWRLTAHYDNRGYQRAKSEDRAAMQKQADRNQELQRAAEKRYTVQAGVRERVIEKTVTEIRYETVNLAACVLTPGAHQRLRDAARCAREDSAAACGPGQPVPMAR